MTALDDAIAGLGDGGAGTALLVAVLLGLRHATDPDHVTAVSVLALSERPGGGRRTSLLGLSWGAGHAATLILLGLPVVVFSHRLPAGVEQAAEVLVGALIVALAVRLLWRWRRGYFHSHPHSHGSVRHSHPHAHARAAPHRREHEHPHAEALGRSGPAAFGIGLVHGAGGSAPVALVLIGTAPGRTQAAALLVLFAAGTAASMAGLSAALGYALARPAARRAQAAAVPLLASASLLFGVSYGLGAL
jgi:ABC-type nickel/cobalt efflux system permease component RcnA